MRDSTKLAEISASDSDVTPGAPSSHNYSVATIPSRLRREMVRKSLHMLIALVPSIAAVAGVETAMALLSLGTVVFAVSEYLRQNGYTIAIITPLTVVASRVRDRDRFVLGPVTLAVGAMLALLIYPAAAAALAIYALAFGDSVASLVGSAFGRKNKVTGKSVEGSLACFTTVWFVALMVTGRIEVALVIAGVATVLEALPTNDLDNVILPVGVGLATTIMLRA